MARLEAKALAGYYPLPPHITLAIADLIDATPAWQSDKHDRYGSYAFFDPCAGRGEAILSLSRSILKASPSERVHRPISRLYGCELERGRYKALEKSIRDAGTYYHDKLLEGDAFRIHFTRSESNLRGASVLLLNPPYDTHKEYGREEHRWLERFTDALVPGSGILIYVVPHYALGVSAAFFAQHYEKVYAYRFPREDFEAYKQVVVVAVRRETPSPFDTEDHPIAQKMRTWSESADEMPPIIPGLQPVVSLPPLAHDGFSTFEIAPLNIGEIRKNILPWRANGRWLIEIEPISLLNQVYPTAMPPRPAHIAEATAAGVLNAHIIYPNDSETGLPPLLIKGTYSKEHTILEERLIEKKVDGNKTVEQQEFITVEQPKMHVYVLDMNSYRYYEIQPGDVPTGNLDLAEMNIADLLQFYGRDMAATMMRQCPPLHDPVDPDGQIDLPVIQRPLWASQEQVAQTLLKLLCTEGSAFLLGEVGTGKTAMSLAVMEALQPQHYINTLEQLRDIGLQQEGKLQSVRRVLVVHPPHLTDDWKKEATTVLPGARVIVLESISDLATVYQEPIVEDDSLPGAGITIALLTRERAKLGHKWVPGAYRPTVNESGTKRRLYCPSCGKQVEEIENNLPRRRLCCDGQRMLLNNEFAQLGRRLAEIMMLVVPGDEAVRALIPGRYAQANMNSELNRRLALKEDEQGRAAANAFYTRALAGGTPRVEDTPIGWFVEMLANRAEEILKAGDAVSSEINKYITPMLALCMAIEHRGRDSFTFRLIRRLYKAAQGDDYRLIDVKTKLLQLALTLQPDQEIDDQGNKYFVKGKRLQELDTILAADSPQEKYSGLRSMQEAFGRAQKRLFKQLAGIEEENNRWLRTVHHDRDYLFNGIKVVDGKIGLSPETYNTPTYVVGDWTAAVFALRNLAANGSYSYEERCNTPLYHAAGLNERVGDFSAHVTREKSIRAALIALSNDATWTSNWRDVANLPAPDEARKILEHVSLPVDTHRFPIATYIANYQRGLFDLLVLDEAHEYNGKGSAQEIAAHRLSRLMPTLALTGSLSNGYAESLFANMWALSPRFRKEFDYDQMPAFVDRYGYRKVKIVVDPADLVEMHEAVSSYGRVSDRIEYGAKTRHQKMGKAPGILPLFTMLHLLPVTASIQKSDLEGQVIPTFSEHPVLVQIKNHTSVLTQEEAGDDVFVYTAPDTEWMSHLMREYKRVEQDLVAQIAEDAFQPEKSGRLWGQMGALPSLLDRATSDTGNTPHGVYEVRYPESMGGELVSAAKPIPGDVILPKEQWMLKQLQIELNEGRNCIVFVWHTNLIDRLEKIIKERFGECVAVLRASRVPTKVRKRWIDENVIAPGKRILITNPVPVSTGLNNLIWANTAIWMQQPAVNPITYRQANGRLVRPGHTEETVKHVRIFVPVYADTTQDTLRLLLGQKVSVSLQADGQDVSSTLAAVGGAAKQDGINVMRAGQALYRMLVEGEYRNLLEVNDRRKRSSLPSRYWKEQPIGAFATD